MPQDVPPIRWEYIEPILSDLHTPYQTATIVNQYRP